MKKIVLATLLAGISLSGMALAAETSNDKAGIYDSDTDTFEMGARPIPPRPPMMIEAVILDMGARPRPRPPMVLSGGEE